MGCDIHTVAQRRDERGAWVNVEGPFVDSDGPFTTRNYACFALFAGVRNANGTVPISEPRGIPDGFDVYAYEDATDSWFGDHSFSWLSLDEITSVDFDRTEAGHLSLRRLLGEEFFIDLALLNDLKAERIVLGFDN